MSAWWYVESNRQTGPLEQEEFIRLIQSGKIGPATLLWKQGMPTWRPFDQIEELQAFRAVLPPALYPVQSTLQGSPMPASPLAIDSVATSWPRFFARIFDIWLEITFTAFVLGVVLSLFFPAFEDWINRPGTGQISALLCLPIALALDAVLYRYMGNTPGKAMLGLKVVQSDGSTLRLGQYLKRNLWVWVSGLAFGLPLLNLWTMARQAHRLSRELPASYDQSQGHRVQAKPVGGVRKLVFGIAFLGLFSLMMVLNAMEAAAQRTATPRGAPDYSWTNPVTDTRTKIDSRWTQSVQTNPDGQEIYVFTERANRASLVLGIEHVPGFTLKDYVAAFRKAQADKMRFADDGQYLEKSGRQVWEGKGKVLVGINPRLHVRIVRVGENFWRVVTIQTMPYSYSDPLVEKIQAGLWNTVFSKTI